MAFVASGEDVPVDLSIIVVNFNTKAVTLEALDSLFRYPPPLNFEVILLDNASSDGSVEAINAAYPALAAIAHPVNVGFAAGNNVAAEMARGRRILLLNPDTITLPNSHAELWAFAEQEPSRGIWGGRTLFRDHSLNPTSCWRRMTPWSLFCSAVGLTYLLPGSRVFQPELCSRLPTDRVSDVDIVTGCFLLIDTSLWQRLGGFDPAFFMYGEEADLCLRAAKLNARCGVTPKAEIIHLGGMSEASDFTEADKMFKLLRGRVTLMSKHWSAPDRVLGHLLLLLWAGLRYVGSRFVSGKRDRPGASRSKWGEVWRRRREWLAGYDGPKKVGT